MGLSGNLHCHFPDGRGVERMSTVEATYRNAWSLEWDFRMSARARNVWKLDAEKVIEGIKNQPLRKLFRTHDKALWIKLYLNSADPVEKIADEVLALEERRDIRRLAREFNPNQPRDEDGKWTGGGGGAEGGGAYHSLKDMPDSIEGVSIIKKPLPGGQLAIGGSAGIAVSTSKKAREAWKDMKAYTEKAFAAGWASSPHPNYVIWHELAHVKVKTGDADNDSMLSNLRASNNPYFEKMASKVSTYAKTNGHEFVAEVFAAVRGGRKLDDDVMDYYYKVTRGPKP